MSQPRDPCPQLYKICVACSSNVRPPPAKQALLSSKGFVSAGGFFLGFSGRGVESPKEHTLRLISAGITNGLSSSYPGSSWSGAPLGGRGGGTPASRRTLRPFPRMVVVTWRQVCTMSPRRWAPLPARTSESGTTKAPGAFKRREPFRGPVTPERGECKRGTAPSKAPTTARARRKSGWRSHPTGASGGEGRQLQPLHRSAPQ